MIRVAKGIVWARAFRSLEGMDELARGVAVVHDPVETVGDRLLEAFARGDTIGTQNRKQGMGREIFCVINDFGKCDGNRWGWLRNESEWRHHFR